ncbi:sigma-70 family RNA polymerase sigma factor [Pendulispora albinea]|uniref:Sigma-70 family RNA polymerase sigma factor n=1 Tax=Pendulispora albinea TaxID=2741071 RepID=A0ABZ2LVC2_9BACT
MTTSEATVHVARDHASPSSPQACRNEAAACEAHQVGPELDDDIPPPPESEQRVRTKKRSRRRGGKRRMRGNNRERADRAAKEIRRYLPIVHQMVTRLLVKVPSNVLREDLIAAGTFGLLASIRRDGAVRSPTFEWYARVRIRGAIMDELRNQDWLSRRARREVHNVYGDPLPSERCAFVGFDDLTGGLQSVFNADVSPPTPLEVMEADQKRSALKSALKTLSERERHILFLHYFQGEQFKTIAETLGVSLPRVSQLHWRAVSKLREVLSAMAA